MDQTGIGIQVKGLPVYFTLRLNSRLPAHPAGVPLQVAAIAPWHRFNTVDTQTRGRKARLLDAFSWNLATSLPLASVTSCLAADSTLPPRGQDGALEEEKTGFGDRRRRGLDAYWTIVLYPKGERVTCSTATVALPRRVEAGPEGKWAR